MAMAWLYGPMAAGAPVVAMASRVMGPSWVGGAPGLGSWPREDPGRRDERRAVPGPASFAGGDRGTDPVRGRGRLGMGRIEGPEVGPEPTVPPGVRAAGAGTA